MDFIDTKHDIVDLMDRIWHTMDPMDSKYKEVCSGIQGH